MQAAALTVDSGRSHKSCEGGPAAAGPWVQAGRKTHCVVVAAQNQLQRCGRVGKAAIQDLKSNWGVLMKCKEQKNWEGREQRRRWKELSEPKRDERNTALGAQLGWQAPEDAQKTGPSGKVVLQSPRVHRISRGYLETAVKVKDKWLCFNTFTIRWDKWENVWPPQQWENHFSLKMGGWMYTKKQKNENTFLDERTQDTFSRNY